MTQSLVLSIAGFASAFTGIWINWGLGWALLIGGVLVFVVGGLLSTREAR